MIEFSPKHEKQTRITIIVVMEEGAQVHTRRKQKKQLQSEKFEWEARGQNAESPLNVCPDDTVLERGGASEPEETISLAMILHELRDFRRDNSDQLKKDIKEDILKTNDRLEEAEERIVGLEESKTPKA